jgi:hypothetical protein
LSSMASRNMVRTCSSTKIWATVSSTAL